MAIIYHHTRTRPHPRRAGWTIQEKFYVPSKTDGTPDKRATPRVARGTVHYHHNGHKRIYKNNVLFFERYAKARGKKT
jgi:hypothetical protein